MSSLKKMKINFRSKKGFYSKKKKASLAPFVKYLYYMNDCGRFPLKYFSYLDMEGVNVRTSDNCQNLISSFSDRSGAAKWGVQVEEY